MEIKEKIICTHELLDLIKEDGRKPKYHFCVPFDLGFPADPNAPFYANGKYHLFFIYENRSDSYRWGHAISFDLLHWSFVKDALIPDEKDKGIYSGGVYLDSNNTATIAYWALGGENQKDCLRIATSSDKDFLNFTKSDTSIITNTELGIAKVKDEFNQEIEIGAADPSNIWKVNNTYYLQTGNLLLLNKYRGQENKNVGDHAYLFKSNNLKDWEYVHEFYDRKIDNSMTDKEDDCMCPYFHALPLGKNPKKFSNVFIELFLSHNKGTQYYLGDYDINNQKFIIKKHGKMSFVDNNLFAPEAMITPDKRLISFYWQRDNQDDDLNRELTKGWSGVHSLPRELFLNKHGSLGMAPLREIFNLRRKIEKNIKNPFTKIFTKESFNTDCAEILIYNFKIKKTRKIGIKINFDYNSYIEIYLDCLKKALVFDLTNSLSLGRVVYDFALIDFNEIDKPYLDIFIDHCVIDAFCSDLTAISRQVFERNPNNRIISFIYDGDDSFMYDIYEMMY